MNRRLATLGAAAVLIGALAPGSRADTIRPARERYADPEVKEVPDFQRHILPLVGRLGCNSRSCHGSFQGQGGFRLSLFGYDFKMDHDALMKDGSHRVETDNPEASKILQKPTLTIPHKGGERLKEDTWQYRMFVRWIEEGAKSTKGDVAFEKLEVTPTEIVFSREGETVPLKVVAYWSDGTQEDVTCITRFRTNDESIAEINEDGVVTSKGKGDTHVVAFYDNGVSVTQTLLPVSDRVGPKYPDVDAPTKVDALVVAKLRKLGIVPAEVCTDGEFLRRVSLDMTGTLPTPEEVRAFLADSSPNKRERKVDELLSRPTYAAWWTNKLCDLTGNSPRNLQMQVNTDKPSRFWYDWIYKRVKDNVPYDKLIEGIVMGTSRTRPGQSYEEYVKEEATYYRDENPADFTARPTLPFFWARRTLRTPEEKALGFSYTFLGVRLECAQCHKHPFDQWTQDDFNQFTAFFRNVRYGNAADAAGREFVRQMTKELNLGPKATGNERRLALSARMKEGKPIPWTEVFVATGAGGGRRQTANNTASKSGRVATPKLLGAETIELEGSGDPRQPLMDWLRRKDNPYFAKSVVNRVWANYFGSGIINPPDDMNLANPPSNAALLDYLAEQFIDHNFDMKWLHREIVASQAYQRSWQTNETNRLDAKNFSRAIVRRLPAEVLIDAVAQATASTTDLVQLASVPSDRAIGSRATANYRRGGDYAARVFGRSTRETNCDCARSDDPNLLQSIYMQNDQDVLGSIERSGGWLSEVTKTPGIAGFGGGRGGNGPGMSRTPAEVAERIATAESRVAELRKDGKTDQAERIDGQLANMKRELRRMAQAEKESTRNAKDVKPAAFDAQKVIAEAYMRTLCRNPHETEATAARDYIRQAQNARDGLRDLLWALLNTKEFITNH